MAVQGTAVARRGVLGARPGELRLAAIDVGSNSLHMVIAQVDGSGGVTTLWRMKEMVGLGRLSFPSHRLSRGSMDRAVITLGRFLEETRRRQCEQILAVATSAVREAKNGGDFIERVRRDLGLHVRVVSARDEAKLIYLGVRQEMHLDGQPNLLMDVGGGSVEFVVADSRRPLLLESRKLGAARMSAKFVRSDPVEAGELKRLARHYDQELTPLMESIRACRPVRMIGTSGTIENLAVMCGADSSDDGARLCREALSKLLSRLIESRSEDRAKMSGLDDQRKDQILAGAMLVHEVMQRLDVPEMLLCRAALREGILVDYLSRHRPELQIRSRVPEPRRRAVMDLGRRCHWHREHSEHVARLCMRLYDDLRPLHGLGSRERELIEYGALLHDIGALISRNRHHKHSQYLILNGELSPFSQREVEIIANIARYHRKAPPRKRHPGFAKLSEADRYIVCVGAALLRIADGLDRTNGAVVEDVRGSVRGKHVELRLRSRSDAELEVWSARARSRLLTELFGRDVSFITISPSCGGARRRVSAN